MLMNLNKIEKNLGKFSRLVLEKMDYDLTQIERKSVTHKWDKTFNEYVKL